MNIEDLLKHPEKAQMALREAIWNNDAKLAEALIPIARDPHLTLNYAQNIVKGKVKIEFEDIIARDGEASFYYAYEVLNGPFPRGEYAIAENEDLSLDYAIKVLKDRFPKGEEAIIYVALKHDDDVYLWRYTDFLKEIGKLDEFLKDHPEVKDIE